MSSLIIEVCRIEKSYQHPNADKLSIVEVKGWNCITGLNQYQVGDLVVFIPPDSIMPDNLIEKYNLEYLRKNGKVGTVKLRGFVSQGLVVDLPEGNWKEGDNLAEYLGITKWQPPAAPSNMQPKQANKKKINPAFSKYTEIENIKNYNRVFSTDDDVVITEKIHGSNFRCGRLPILDDKNQPLFYRIRSWINRKIFKKTYEFVWGSHNVQITHHENRNSYYGDDIWGKIVKKYNLGNIVPEDYIIYGEIYGKGVQDLTYGLDDIELAIFDIKYKDEYLNHEDVMEFCYDFGLPTVPVLYTGKFSEEILESCTNGRSVFDPDQIKEGAVVKSLIETNVRIGRKILKSISPDYLLRKNGTEFK
jgi:RNA ligase (TIGR02306 family)